jgi:hypothetical protein
MKSVTIKYEFDILANNKDNIANKIISDLSAYLEWCHHNSLISMFKHEFSFTLPFENEEDALAFKLAYNI